MPRPMRLVPAAAAAFALAGCADAPPPVADAAPPAAAGGHVHEPGAHSAPHPVPAPPADADQALYLTPGGKYTEADIAANGRAVAGAKFKGIKAEHDLKPRPGDPICPVTLTKANPKFAWVVGGQTYLFCCPPCVDEFVTLAKEKPAEVREPGHYKQK